MSHYLDKLHVSSRIIALSMEQRHKGSQLGVNGVPMQGNTTDLKEPILQLVGEALEKMEVALEEEEDAGVAEVEKVRVGSLRLLRQLPCGEHILRYSRSNR